MQVYMCIQYRSKESWQSFESLDSRLGSWFIEQVMENRVEDRISQDGKQKIRPWLISR